MAQLFTFNLGTTGKASTTGYQFYDASGSSLGARSTTGVTEFGSSGIYFRTQNLPAGAVAVVWNDTDTGKWAADDAIGTAADIAAVKSDTAAILADTGTTLDGKIDAIQAVTDLLPDAGALSSLATQASVDAVPTATENADALLKRDWTSVTGEAARSVLNALRFLRNKWSLSGSTLTVTKENDSDAAWTAAVSTDAAAVPVVGSDPA